MDYALAIAVPERRKQATGDSTKTANEARRKSAIKKAKADIKAQLAAEGKAADEDDIRIAKAPANEESEEQKQWYRNRLSDSEIIFNFSTRVTRMVK